MTKKKLFSCVTRLSMIGILPNLQFWKRHPRCAKSNCTRKPRSWPLHHCWQERWTWWPPGRPTCLCPHTSCPLRALGTYSYPSRGPSSPHRCYEHPLSRRGWPQYTLSISLHGTQCTECTCTVSQFPRFWDKMGWCKGHPLLTNESSGLSDLVRQKCVHLDTFKRGRGFFEIRSEASGHFGCSRMHIAHACGWVWGVLPANCLICLASVHELGIATNPLCMTHCCDSVRWFSWARHIAFRKQSSDCQHRQKHVTHQVLSTWIWQPHHYLPTPSGKPRLHGSHGCNARSTRGECDHTRIKRGGEIIAVCNALMR